MPETTSDDVTVRRYPAVAGLLAGVGLIALATVVGLAGDTDLADRAAPLTASWGPRLAPASAVAAVLAMTIIAAGPSLARRGRWPLVLLVGWVASVVWITALVYVDGREGVASVYADSHEYLPDARTVTDVGGMLPDFIDRIPSGSSDSWRTHTAGHPPGALLLFIGMLRLGLESSWSQGIVTIVVAGSTVPAVALCVRTIAGEEWGRRVVPFLVLTPAAVWMGVSADALFMAFAAWGLTLLAWAATRRSLALSVLAGLVLGWCVYLSYGLALLGLLAIAILVVARTARPLAGALAGTAVVAIAFTLAGFHWWEALPVLRERYYDGIASERPYSYWVWANLAAGLICVGPGFAAAAGALGAYRRRLLDTPGARAVGLLAASAAVIIVVATVSGMSKAEVERIWLPFVVWLLPAMALLPRRDHRWLLGVQALAALTIQTLIVSPW